MIGDHRSTRSKAKSPAGFPAGDLRLSDSGNGDDVPMSGAGRGVPTLGPATGDRHLIERIEPPVRAAGIRDRDARRQSKLLYACRRAAILATLIVEATPVDRAHTGAATPAQCSPQS